MNLVSLRVRSKCEDGNGGIELPIVVRWLDVSAIHMRTRVGGRRCGEDRVEGVELDRLETGVHQGTKICDCESESKVNLV